MYEDTAIGNHCAVPRLGELVAYDEGLFEKEGIQIEWMDREKGVDKSPQLHITDHKEASRYTSHGKMMEQGQADLYNACEWGNFSRVETTNVGSRQVGRRSMVNFAGIVVRADSPVQVPQQFANVQIGVPFIAVRTISACRCWKASCRAS